MDGAAAGVRLAADRATDLEGPQKGVGILPLEACMQLGVTGPILRSAGLPWDLRKTMPYCGYENYDFEVPELDGRTATPGSCSGWPRCGNR